MNPYEPHDLIASCERTLAAWDKMSLAEKIQWMKQNGLFDQDGNTHPDYDWTPERYAREFSPPPPVDLDAILERPQDPR